MTIKYKIDDESKNAKNDDKISIREKHKTDDKRKNNEYKYICWKIYKLTMKAKMIINN